MRLSGVYLAMLTLAFAQIVWSIVFQWEDVTGGSNGILGIWPRAPFDSRPAFYLLTLALVAAGVLLLRRFLFAPFGYAMRAGRDSPCEPRRSAWTSKRIHWIGFAIAGAFCGVAGGLFAYAKGTISPEVVAVSRSIDGMVMVLLGGLQTLTGPDRRRIGVRRLAGHHHAPDRVLARIARRRHSRAGAGVPRRHCRRHRQVVRGAENGAVSTLSIRNLSKSFGGVHAVDNVSFDLNAGEFLAMIGPNGAGKSTCFNMINGQIEPESGEILFQGHSISGLRPRNIWRLGVGRTFQIAATFGSMTVAENVQMALISHAGETYRPGGRPPRITASARSNCCSRSEWEKPPTGLPRASLWRRQARRTGDCARQRAAPAADGRADRRHGAARAQCDDRAGQETCRRARDFGAVYRALHGRGVRLCDRILVLARGMLIADGTAESIRDNPEVQQVYLGTGKTYARAVR